MKNRVLKVVLDFNVSAQNYKMVMSFLATGRLAAFRQGIRARADLLPPPPPSQFKHHENGQS